MEPAKDGEKKGTDPATTAVPISRVKRIMKTDKDVNTIDGDATFLVAKAAVRFV